MKRIISLFLTITMFVAVIPEFVFATGDNVTADVWDGTVATEFASGSGAENDPYIISSAEELAYLASSTYNALSTSTAAPISATVSGSAGIYNAYTGVYFKLTSDIDLGNKEWTPIGRQGMRFNGTFDGNGHVIKNLKMTTPYMGMGLFGATGINVKITKLGIEKASFDYSVSVGGAKDKVVSGGDASYTVAEEPGGDGRVYATGALVGIFAGGTFEDCYAKDVTINRGTGVSQSNAGGLLGGPYCTNPGTTSSDPTTVVKVNRCYVNDFTTTGGAITCLGGIAGSAANNSNAGRVYGCAADFDYCYVVNTNFATTGKVCAMIHTRYSANSDAMNVNCYADRRYNEAPSDTVAGYAHYPKLMTSVTDWDEQFIATGYWSADKENAPINGGYPVLLWQDTWTVKPTVVPTVAPTPAPTATPVPAATPTPTLTPTSPATPTQNPTEAPTTGGWDGTVATEFAKGNGTQSSPYEISSAEELAYLASSTYNALSTSTAAPISATVSGSAGIYNAYTGVYFKLTSDIDLGNKEWTPIGRQGMRFNGTFDGNGHVIKNLKMTTPYMGMGLFGATGINVKITKLGIEKASFDYSVSVGGAKDKVVSGGDASYTVAEEPGGDGRVYATGALVGIFAGGTFEDCYAKDVTINRGTGVSQSNAGGLLGGPYCTNPGTTSSDPTTVVKVNCCYVNGFTTTGGTITCLGGIAGSASNNLAITYGCVADLDYCYVINTNFATTGKACAMIHTRYSANSDAMNVNCYADRRYNEAPSDTVAGYAHYPKLMTSVTDWDEQFIATGYWSADNEKFPINDGYPVLAWQNTWSSVPTAAPTPTLAPTPVPTPTLAPTPTPAPATVPDVVWEGNGTEENPYLITSKEELFGLASKTYNAESTSTDVPVVVTNTAGIYNAYTGVYFKLTTDIDLSNEEWLPIGRYGMRFNGIFDGNAHVIKNLKINKQHFGMGLFGATGINVKITKLGIENVSMKYETRPSAGVNDPQGDADPSYSVVNSTDGKGRVENAAALVAIFSGGTFEDCFARNVSITAEGRYSQTNAGGLLGGAHCTTSHRDAYLTQPNTAVTANRCYVNGVKISGIIQFLGAFAGAARNASTVYYNGCAMKFTDCYASNADIVKRTNTSAFADGRYATASAFTRCYATDSMNSTGGEYRNDEAMIRDKASIIAELADGGHGFVLDGNHFSKNGGMPILLWEAPWLDGEETNIVSAKLLNTITNGQSSDYIFNNLNFPKTIEVDGVAYKMDYISILTDFISNSGKVSHSGEERDVLIWVYMYNPAEDKYYKEPITLTVAPRGICVFAESFDGELTEWSTSSAFSTSESFSQSINDKMLNITTVDGSGVMSREFINSGTGEVYNDGILNLVFSIYKDTNFDSVSVNMGGAVVSVRENSVTINGQDTVISLPEGSENTWVPVKVKANLNDNTIGVTIGDYIVENDYDFTTVSKILILEGQAKLDKMLVYEYIPEELDALTEEMVLNGNESKFDVKTPLYMPTEIPHHRGKLNVKWESSNESVVALDGQLGVVEMSEKVTLTAYAYDASELGDDESPTEEDYLATKTFEMHVVPVGSRLVYASDFNDASTEGMAVSSYPGWTDTTNPYTKFTMERDPLSNPSDTFASVNKALKVSRLIAGSEDAPTESAACSLGETLNADLIELSYDIYVTTIKNLPMVRIGGLTEIYVRDTGGYFNWASGIGDKSISATWYFKPGTWQNHKYIVDTVNKTVSLYVDGTYRHQVRYNSGTDSLASFTFGSQRLWDPVGSYYFDNPTVRVIMPEDGVAVDTVKGALSVPETVTGNIELPTDGAYETDIWWESSDKAVIDINGTVSRQAENKEVTLTAYVAKGNTVSQRQFNVTVKAFAQDAEATDVIAGIAERFTFSEISDESQFAVTNDLNLVRTYNKGDAKRLGGVNITWESSDESIIAISGNVTQSYEDKCVVLTATFEKDGAEAKKKFKVYVRQAGASAVITEDFDSYEIGANIETASSDWTYDVSVSNIGNARALYKGKDSDNKVLFVKRKSAVGDIDMNFAYDVNMTSTDIMFSTAFKLEKVYDIIKLEIGGVDQTITIKNTGIKIDANEFPIMLNCGEWYQLSTYYDSVTGTYLAFVDTKKLMESPIPYLGEGGIKGVAVKNIKKDRGGSKWSLDEMCVRDIAISNDDSAIEAALKEISLETDQIEWNIEGLPEAGRYGVSLEWISSDEKYLENDGTVHRDSQDHTVTFTVKGSRNGVTIDKPFTVTVLAIPDGFKPAQEIFDKHMSEIPFSYYTQENIKEITQDINLPSEYIEGNAAFYGGADISWSSDNKKVIDDSGKVMRPYFDEAVNLTATYTSKRDPSIKKVITYNLTVWAEGEVVFEENFENIPAEWEGQRVGAVDDRFTQEAPPHERVQPSLFAKDALDFDKSWAEANKVVSIERLIGYGEMECERNWFKITPNITDIDSVAVSFDVMLETPGVAINIGPNLYNLPMISNTSFAYQTNKAGQLQEKKWYRFTFIIMKSAGLISVLCDGKKVLQDSYIYQSTGSVLSSIYFDIERHQPPGKFYFDNIIVRDLTSEDDVAVKEAINAVAINEGDVYENLILQNTGINRTLISYSSSDTEVLSEDGTVTRPMDADREVELTATVRRGSAIENKVFKLNIKKSDAYTTPFIIDSINTSQNRKLSSVKVSNQTSYAGEDMYLVVLAYDKSDLKAARCIPLSSFNGTADIAFDEIDLSDVEFYRVESYIIDGVKTISNRKVVSY